MRWASVAVSIVVAGNIAADDADRGMERIVVAPDRTSFVRHTSGELFVPWGFNYDHDRDGRLIEDYWHAEWNSVAEDFAEMKALGANVVRVHLQFGKFMESPEQPRQQALDKLADLLQLAEESGLYLDLTGLGCYHKADVPEWYDALDEPARWEAQGEFWEAVAKTCASSPAVFCYDLMNEPVVPGARKSDDWLGPAFGDKHFVQRISLDLQGRERTAVAKAWVDSLVATVRRHDERHLVTVGLVPWSLKRPGLQSGFEPDVVCENLDFIAMHLYPEKGKLDEALETLRGFDVGKPVVIEETFCLKCGPDELQEFLLQSREIAHGWIGFYWGVTPGELAAERTIPAAMTLGWLELFQELRPVMTQPMADRE